MPEQTIATNKDLPITEIDERDAASNVVSLYSGMSTKNLQKQVDKMTAQRQVIAGFVKDHLKEGVDYGTIESTSKSGKAFKSKPTLYKPGQEKIFSLFGLVSELVRDQETLEMLSEVTNLVAYKCNVYKNNVKVAEGRGAAVIGDLGRDANSTIKIAEKRARMDACLTLGFSEYFTQDLEDPEYRKKNYPSSSTHTRQQKSVDDGELMTDNQRKLVYKLLEKKGLNKDDMRSYIKLKTEIEDPKDLTKHKASSLIKTILGEQEGEAS